MKILSVHAHFDDFEFAAGGTFEVWRQKSGSTLESLVVVSTDGKAGHQFRSREETGRIRLQEQEESARIGRFRFQPLRLSDGTMPREACLQVTPPLLAALWKTIRDFEPHYLFCPPVPSDPLAGIHVDHVAVAEAIRKVAYMINVPHAFTPEYPMDETHSRLCRVPVILNMYDAYMAGENNFDLAIDIEAGFDAVCETSYCHQSQIAEWLPWVGRHALAAPASLSDWSKALRERFLRRNREMGLKTDRIHEFFTITAWGEIPSLDQIIDEFPDVNVDFSNLERLGKRLRRWRGDGD